MKNKIVLLLFFTFQFAILFGQQNNFYWENETSIESGNIGKIDIVNNNQIIGVVFSENTKTRQIFIKYSPDSFKWTSRIMLINDFYSNNPNGVDFTSAVDGDNNLFLCYRTDQNSIVIEKFLFEDRFSKKEKIYELKSENIIYLPYLFISENGEISLTLLENTNKDVKIRYKKLDKKGLVLFENTIGDNYKSPLNPFITESKGVLYIVFQAKDTAINEVFYFNIILGTSNDGGKTWKYVTLVNSTGQNNQRPHLLIDNKIVHLVWEKDDENLMSHINYKSFGIELNKIDEFEVSSKFSEAHLPYLLRYNNYINIFWYDNLRGSFQNYFSFIYKDEPTEPKILRSKNGRTNSIYITLYKDKPLLFWLQGQDKENIVYYLKSDSYVETPDIIVRSTKKIGNDFITNNNNITFLWNEIPDIAGIKGFRILLTKNEDEEIASDSRMLYYGEREYSYNDLIDGTWYFKIKAYDNAGNISKTAVYKFEIDTIQPEPPEFVSPLTDESGDLTTNSPVISWRDNAGEIDTYRYYYRLFINKDDNFIENARKSAIFDKVVTTSETEYKFTKDLDNGKLLVGIQGIDKIGNESETVWNIYNLNKYKTRTIINNIYLEVSKDNEKLLNILGRGFSVEGKIEKIIIDKDKEEPYDYEISKSDFIVYNDNYIKQIKEKYIEDGKYYIGLYHPTRGITFDISKSVFSQKWAFKYERIDKLSFDTIKLYFEEINLTTLLLILIIIFWIIMIFFLFISIINVGKERLYLKTMMIRLEKAREELNSEEFEERGEIMRKKGLGLTIKYTFLILLLVIMIVSGTAFSISYLAIQNERRNLANEMKEKALIVAKNYHASLKDIYILQKGYTEVVDASNLTATFQDVGFVFFKDQNETDPIIRYGEKEDVLLKVNNIKELKPDEKNKVVMKKIYNSDIKKYMEESKKNFDITTKIYPVLNPDELNDSYIFIQPIILGDDSDKKYVGEMIIGYSFERILKLIEKETYALLYIALLVSGIAMLVSIVGAIFLATTTISPIKKMMKHVELITSKEDYEDLVTDGKDKIIVKSKDEIGILADSINEMTHKLIEKAKADKQLLLGKEIQKKFITLNPIENEKINIYGFYEGAKGVSGDYFEYKMLDQDNYAFIICDVSGKAVPAALIMVQISTIFHSYFANFKIGSEKLEKVTVDIITQINDTVEERGFQGRFAATLVLLLNVKTGIAYLTNAGYTQMLVYREKKKGCEWIKLFPSGAAGVFPSYMLPEPFQSEKINVGHGDILFLFTDGIEEARNGKKTIDEKGEEHFEEFGLERLKDVIDGSPVKTSKAVIDTIMEAENKFRNGGEQYDDLTLLAVQRK